MTPDLSVRAVDARELMDDSNADARMLARTYEQFGLVNAVVSRWHRAYRRDIRPRAARRPLRILDVGAGGGDLPRALAGWMRRDGVTGEVTALDADERAIRWAADRDEHGDVIYRCALLGDLVTAGEVFDVVLSNHLLHHLDAAELPRFLADSRSLVPATGLVAHHDIARSAAAYRLFAAGTLPFSKNLLSGSFIREDGLTSIRRSYTARELAALAPEGWVVRTGMPARLQLRWESRRARP